MRKGFIVRDRSLSSLPSKQLSVNDFMNQKSLALHSQRSKMQQQSKIIQGKDEDISKLRVNLDNALKMAVKQAIVSSRAKQQSSRMTHTKSLYEQKYNSAVENLQEQKSRNMKAQNQILSLNYELEKQKMQIENLFKKNVQKSRLIQKLQDQLKQLTSIKEKIKEIQPLTIRIKHLQHSMRNQKLTSERIQKQKKQLQSQKQDLVQKLRKVKPYQQQLQEKIKYLERVNLELQRKMEDFHRRQHEYKRQIQHYKNLYNKMTNQKNKYTKLYEDTHETLQSKLIDIQNLQKELSEKKQNIKQLKQNLQKQTETRIDLETKLKQTIDFYKSMEQENQLLKKKNKVLVQFQLQARRTMAAHLKVAQQTNLYIISRNNLILSLQQQNKSLKDNIDELEKKFTRLDKCVNEGTARGDTEVKQSFYGVIRQNDKLKVEIKEMKVDHNDKIIKYGQQRDNLMRKVSIYVAPQPSEQSPYQAIIADKTQEILMLESSNDQLLKIKKQLQEKIKDLQKLNEQAKKQIYNLRLKAADLFKIKKQLQEANKKIQRYQQMIQEQKNMIADLNQQIQILRAKTKQVQQKNFVLDLQNKNTSFKLQEYQNIMKQLDVEFLEAKKTQNEKNAHLLSDSIQKMQSGIGSLAYYFSCCFCGELLATPITLAICGHNYCNKCKEAYAQYCYECDTGAVIQRVYQSKFLKQASAKYKFLTMVVEQVKQNLIKIGPQ